MLNTWVLWSIVSLDRTLTELRAECPVLDVDVARLPAYPRQHIDVHGNHPFRLPDLGGACVRCATPITPTTTTNRRGPLW
ncbi:hypothetical protein ACGF7U_28535 [Micromonospora sp. NPDC047670]|uniref:hypothetical protein n=1 Tax=Micromonospora sp. NPDC047670 TaxID=3364252 RepID=UPI0037157EA9